jgi:hypothetical protein
VNGKTTAGLAVLSLIASAAFASRSEEAPPSARLIPVAGAQTMAFGAGAV